MHSAWSSLIRISLTLWKTKTVRHQQQDYTSLSESKEEFTVLILNFKAISRSRWPISFNFAFPFIPTTNPRSEECIYKRTLLAGSRGSRYTAINRSGLSLLFTSCMANGPRFKQKPNPYTFLILDPRQTLNVTFCEASAFMHTNKAILGNTKFSLEKTK